jgi:23S rRNA (uracil1939-C5)-methyltransferase
LLLAVDEVRSGQASYEEIILGRVYRVSAPSFFQVNTRIDARAWPAQIGRDWSAVARASATAPGAVGEVGGLPPDSFDLHDLSQADLLVLLVLDRLHLTGREFVVDAYSGVGTFSLPIAERARRVVGIEEARSAVHDAEHNAGGQANLGFIAGRTEDYLSALDDKPDAVVLDPSRVGCDSAVLVALASLRPETVIYVSCDPATLARDLAQLTSNGYELVEVQPIDMFPQTSHVETVSVLKGAR